MAEDKPNTVNRDHDYGTKANTIYEQYKLNAQACFKLNSDNCLANLVDSIENPKVFFFIPVSVDKNGVGFKAAREGVEDAYLERNLPSPFPNRAVPKPKTTER